MRGVPISSPGRFKALQDPPSGYKQPGGVRGRRVVATRDENPPYRRGHLLSTT